jgi:hypothetical protein
MTTKKVVGAADGVNGNGTVCDPGMMDNELICWVDAAVTVKDPTPITILLSGLVAIAVMTVVPWPTAVASPVVRPIVATPAVLELHLTLLVTFVWVPFRPEVAIAMNCPVWPGAATDKLDGRIEMEAIGSGVPPDLPVTVKVAEPVTTDLSGLEY